MLHLFEDFQEKLVNLHHLADNFKDSISAKERDIREVLIKHDLSVSFKCYSQTSVSDFIK